MNTKTLVNKDFELKEKYEFTMPLDGLSQTGIDAIQALVSSATSYRLPDNWDYSWIIDKGKYVGTLPKRIGKFCYELGAKLTNDQLSDIGNLARAHSLHELESLVFDFTDDFSWRAGEFGDGGSCYWNSRASAKDTLMNSGALAIRFYRRNDRYGEGYSRAWIMPAQPNDNTLLVFNGYGVRGIDATLKIARILATWLGLSYKKIALTVNGDDDGTVWINKSGGEYNVDGHGTNGSGIGYVIGDHASIKELTSCDLVLEEAEEQYEYHCHDCGEGLSEDDDHYSELAGASYCESCYNDIFSICDHCNEEMYQRYSHEAHSSRGWNMSICEDCASQSGDFFTCDHCDDMEHIDNYNSLENGDYSYCNDCFARLTGDCDHCHERFMDDDLSPDGLCADCQFEHDETQREIELERIENELQIQREIAGQVEFTRVFTEGIA